MSNILSKEMRILWRLLSVTGIFIVYLVLKIFMAIINAE